MSRGCEDSLVDRLDGIEAAIGDHGIWSRLPHSLEHSTNPRCWHSSSHSCSTWLVGKSGGCVDLMSSTRSHSDARLAWSFLHRDSGWEREVVSQQMAAANLRNHLYMKRRSSTWLVLLITLQALFTPPMLWKATGSATYWNVPHTNIKIQTCVAVKVFPAPYDNMSDEQKQSWQTSSPDKEHWNSDFSHSSENSARSNPTNLALNRHRK